MPMISDEYDRLHQHAEMLRDFADKRLLDRQEVEQKLPFSLRYGKRELRLSWAGMMLLGMVAVVVYLAIQQGWGGNLVPRW